MTAEEAVVVILAASRWIVDMEDAAGVGSFAEIEARVRRDAAENPVRVVWVAENLVRGGPAVTVSETGVPPWQPTPTAEPDTLF